MHCTLYNVQCTLYSVHCIYIVYRTLYQCIQGTLYSVHCTSIIIWNSSNSSIIINNSSKSTFENLNIFKDVFECYRLAKMNRGYVLDSLVMFICFIYIYVLTSDSFTMYCYINHKCNFIIPSTYNIYIYPL